jgi:hypothetical protein
MMPAGSQVDSGAHTGCCMRRDTCDLLHLNLMHQATHFSNAHSARRLQADRLTPARVQTDTVHPLSIYGTLLMAATQLIFGHTSPIQSFDSPRVTDTDVGPKGCSHAHVTRADANVGARGSHSDIA